MVAVDLFAGLGGWTEAAESLDLPVVIAANHNPMAVMAHAANHPRVRHVQQDLQQANFYEWRDQEPRLRRGRIVLLASPACQGHSEAATGGAKGKGKKRGENPKHDKDRSTAWAVISAAEALHPDIVLVENVDEMLRWKLYRRWHGCLEDLDYQVQVLRLDAADHGVPQERDRIFIVATRKAVEPIVVPEQQRIPVSEVVDLRRGEWQRVRWAAKGVQDRVARARSRGFPEGPFVTQNTTDHSGRSLDRPLGTVTTCAGHWGLVRPGPKGDEYRLLSKGELRDVSGFRRDYWLPRQVTHASKLLGNAIPPPLGRAVLMAVLEAA